MAKNTCPGCASSNPADFDDSNGTLVCTNCGTVLQDSQIVSEITFGETSSGAAMVQGSYVAEGQTHVGGGGKFRSGTSLESRDAAIMHGRRKIVQLAEALKCPSHYVDTAQRWFTLAVTNNFTKGRKTQYVIASCLYISCRNEKSSHMLIDFSDMLGINVFTLGQTYLKLVQTLEVRLPHIDPTVYVHRFAKHLEFGDDSVTVANDALRLIQRMNRDWMVQGRRPSGICGAALLLAARMNNYRRSVREVVYIVKVADLTIQKRLDEFRATKSGDLTVEEFRNIWLEQGHDPPSFGPKPSRKRRVREVNDDGEVIGDKETDTEQPAQKRQRTEAPAVPVEPRRDKDGFVVPEVPIDPALLQAGANPTPPPSGDAEPDLNQSGLSGDADHNDAIAEACIESEMMALIDTPDSTKAVEELKEAHRKELEELAAKNRESGVSDDPDDLRDVDDDIEVMGALLGKDEADLKERIWVEFNKDYLREQEFKRLKRETDLRNGIAKPTKRRQKKRPRDSTSEDLAATPAESAKQMLQRRSYSKKINYKAIEGLFEDD
ncbi:uncharacterized protein H6S33_002308 [Morchella sextelata]|uniref:uncharacterized protein n=1 Tax=Morchella sextelata TaxID=1174677 RepID=UPI001D0454FB|nr:uncharacterized protein H6S33_002308 [Morchella sextelata]KAH0608256.1 hypothetical protein H6S33_002308 [Morchella sextelata]